MNLFFYYYLFSFTRSQNNRAGQAVNDLVFRAIFPSELGKG